MEPWRTAIATSDATGIWIRGRDLTSLMKDATFTDVIMLLHLGRLPSPGERRLLDALLIGVADHGSGAPSCAAARLAASGNRASMSSAVAAGILAIGDDHGGAGSNCMELIAQGLEAGKRDGLTPAAAAMRTLDATMAAKRRIPGLGHRVHTTDPRVKVLFDMARAEGVAGDGILFMEALEAQAARRIKALPMNIDGALAAILHDMGFPPPAGRFMFIIGRVAGLSAEVAEELAREKPMRIKFDVQYDGPPLEPTPRTNEVSEPRERSGAGVPASERAGGAGGAKPPGK
jgi:citrate synthase